MTRHGRSVGIVIRENSAGTLSAQGLILSPSARMMHGLSWKSVTWASLSSSELRQTHGHELSS